MARARMSALALLIAAGCATSAGSMRFANADPIWHVADQRLIPKPDEHYEVITDLIGGLLREPIIDGLDFPGFQRAENINAIGEVPDSTWFINRIGVRDMTPEEIALGPGRGAQAELPLTILRTKIGGAMPGFLVEDASGVRYIFKFDEPFAPELESASDVVVARLLWAVGYWVPHDTIVHFRREDLRIAEDAVQEDALGDEIPLEEQHVDAVLEQIAGPLADGRWRGLLSRFIDGIPIGGYPMKGTRSDDPNDRVDHEDRRDLRAHGVFFAWLAHSDLKEANTLDGWIPIGEEAELGYVRHYLVDFGKALGAMGVGDRRPHEGWSHQWSYGYATASLLTFGLWKRPWEGRHASELRGLGRFTVDGYEPHHWNPLRLWFPLRRMDRFDAFWGSKIIMRFTREHFAAVVEQAQYSDPAAAAYMVEALIGRQRKTARHWFQGVAPFDAFEVQPDGEGTFQVCATDLWKHYGFGDEPTAYRLRGYDYEGDPTGWTREAEADERGRVCATGLEPSASPEEYTVIRFDLRRGDEDLPPALMHVARDEEGELRTVGLHRM